MAVSVPVRAGVDDATRVALAGLAVGDVEVLDEIPAFREAGQASTGALTGNEFAAAQAGLPGS